MSMSRPALALVCAIMASLAPSSRGYGAGRGVLAALDENGAGASGVLFRRASVLRQQQQDLLARAREEEEKERIKEEVTNEVNGTDWIFYALCVTFHHLPD